MLRHYSRKLSDNLRVESFILKMVCALALSLALTNAALLFINDQPGNSWLLLLSIVLVTTICFALFYQLRNRAQLKPKAKKKQSVKELSFEVDQFRDMQNLARVGAWRVDLVKNKIHWDTMVYNIHEVRPGTEIAMDEGIKFYREDYREPVRDTIAASVEKGESWDIEAILITGNDQERWVRIIGYPIYEQEKLIELRGILMDIDDSKKTLLALEKKEERLQLALDSAQVGLWDWDIVSDKVMAGHNFFKLFGYSNTRRRLLSDWIELVHPEDRDNVQISFSKALIGSDTAWKSEFKFKLEDGNFITVLMQCTIVRDDKDEAIRVVGAMEDITEERHNQQELKLMQMVVENANDAILISEAEPLDQPGPKVLYANKAFTDMTGYTPEDIIGKSPRILQGPKTSREELDKLRKSLDDWQPHTAELLNYRKDGEEFWAEISVVPIADETGWFTHWIGIQRHISERVHKMETQKILGEISQVIARSNGLKNQYAEVLKILVDFIDSDVVCGYIFDPEINCYQHAATVYSETVRAQNILEQAAKQCFVFENNLIAKLQKEENIQLLDVATYPSLLQDLDKEECTSKSIVCVPLFHNSNLIGFITLYDCNKEISLTRFAQFFESFKDVFGAELNRMMTEELLSEMNTRYDLATESASLGVWDWNLANNTLIWDDQMFEIYGVEKSDFKGTHDCWRACVHPEDLEACEKLIDESVQLKIGLDIQFRIIHKASDSIRFIRAYAKVLLDEKGNVSRFIGINRDVTERVQNDQKILDLNLNLEEKVQERTTEIQSVTSELEQLIRLLGVSTMISETDTKGKIITVNESFSSLSGYSAEELIGTRHSILKSGVQSQTDYETLWKTISSGGTWQGELCNKNKLGELYWVFATIQPFVDESGEIMRYVGVYFDITQLKESTRKLSEMNTQLDLANRELETFSYSVSHDLKAPLRALQGFSKNVIERYEPTLDDTGKRWLHFIQDNANRMDNLIDDILSYSKIGKASIEKSNYEMKALVEEKISTIEKGYKNETKVVLKELPNIHSDKTMIGVVWQNLIDNAFKYSQKKESPEITIWGESNEAGVTYFVQDNGDGFDMRHYDKLFGIFQRLHSHEEFEGTGVGLANIQRIIDKHNGTISAVGKTDQGATFQFFLPY